MLKILSPIGETFPYIENAKKYLQADMEANVSDYLVKVRNPYVPIKVEWQYGNEIAQKFLVQYARKSDFSDAISVETAGNVRTIDLYNLYKASDYFVRVTAFDESGNVSERAESAFQTTSLGPRVMNIEDICNVRDFGGYKTLDNKTIVQGIAYRGGALTSSNATLDPVLTENGKAYMRDVLGIKTEIDFRSEEESGVGKESVIPGVKLIHAVINGYEAAMDEPERYRNVFSLFASYRDN